MRIVALEEHFMAPDVVMAMDPGLVAARGYPGPEEKLGPMTRREALADLGEGRLRLMDAAGISLQVLSVGGPGADLLPPVEGLGVARELNDRLARAVATYPDRYAGFAHLPMTAPQAAADELERAVCGFGFHGAMINGLTAGRFLDDPVFAPILARADSLRVPIYLHPGIPPASVREAYYDGLPGDLPFMLATAGWGWHTETAVHVLRLVLSGTLDRYPNLQLIIGHMGEGLPAMLARCDQVFGGETPRFLQRSVSQTILEHVYVTTSGFFSLPPFMAALLTFGADRILFSVDYPFSPNAAGRAFLDGLPVSPADKAKIAHGNADRLLRLTM